MYEFLFIIVTAVIAVSLVGYVLWRYISRDDEGGNYREDERGDYGRDHYTPKHHGAAVYQQQQVYYPRHAAKTGGSGSEVTELDELKRRVAYLETQLELLGRDVRQLYGDRRHISQPLITRHREAEQYSNSAGTADVSGSSSSGVARGNYDSQGLALEAYRQLSAEGLRGLPIEPVFVVLDIDSSARGSAIGEAKRNLRQAESKQSAFVIFSDGSPGGWLFPNPKISFTESMKYVFPELGHDNFEVAKNTIAPKRVRSVSAGEWEVVAD
jgi:hypothetical protein